MKANLNITCRSEGRLSILVELDEIIDLDRLTVSASTEGGPALPCSCCPTAYTPSQNPGTAMVISIPQLEKTTQIVTLSQRTGNTDTEIASFKVSPSAAKWKSRFNRVFHRSLITQIERDGRGDSANAFDVALFELIPDGEESIAHVGVAQPGDASAQPQLTCFDERGRSLPIDPIIMGDELLEDTRETTMRAMRYSLRIPTNTPSFTIEVRAADGSVRPCFSTFERHLLDSLRAHWDEKLCHAAVDPAYHDWFIARKATPETVARQSAKTCSDGPAFSIVVPLFRTPINLFEAMADSVIGQSYGNWQLVVVNASPDDEELTRAVDELASRDDRVVCVPIAENRGIAENTNAGIAACSGDFVCFFDHDDLLEPDTLYEYARAVEENPDIDALYCDEDKLTEDGRFIEPHFKPDFSLHLLRTNNYVCHLLCVRKDLLDRIGLLDPALDGAQDHDLTLRAAEHARAIHHVRKVLYHWRITPNSTASAEAVARNVKPRAHIAGETAIAQHLDRIGVPYEMTSTPWTFVHHPKYLVSGNPLVSIIIPNKDSRELLDCCVQSILDKTTYRDFEIVIVENNSEEASVFAYYDEIQRQSERVRVVRWEGAFNFSAIVNFGVQQARGDYLVLLNNDTEVIAGEWMDLMLGICQNDQVGAVGARLLYADGTVQHAGVVLPSFRDVACHVNPSTPDSYPGYFLRGQLTTDCSAVTAACMMTSREAFDAVGGFDENFTVAYNDVDYCLRLRQAGFRVIYEPAARLYHYESQTRGLDALDNARRTRLMKEQALMHYRWTDVLVNGDPFFNPALDTPYFLLKKDAD